MARGTRMSMQLRIAHTTGFEYDGKANTSFNEARLTPLTLPGQIVVHSRVEVSPTPWAYTYKDYWGSQVTAFEVLDPHTSLTVTSSATVHTDRSPVGEPVMSWEEMRTRTSRTPRSTSPCPSGGADRRPGRGCPRHRRRERLPERGRARGLRLVYREVKYVSGSTTVDAFGAHAWAKRSGVCQDMAHIAIGALRAIDIPTRYVSGYLHPKADPVVGESAKGESHAWVEWWDDGWRGFDPTNDTEPGDRHVIVATGRDYNDVKPLSGIFSGSGTSRMASMSRSPACSMSPCGGRRTHHQQGGTRHVDEQTTPSAAAPTPKGGHPPRQPRPPRPRPRRPRARRPSTTAKDGEEEPGEDDVAAATPPGHRPRGAGQEGAGDQAPEPPTRRPRQEGPRQEDRREEGALPRPPREGRRAAVPPDHRGRRPGDRGARGPRGHRPGHAQPVAAREGGKRARKAAGKAADRASSAAAALDPRAAASRRRAPAPRRAAQEGQEEREVLTVPPVTRLEADYLVVGAGAMGMAFTDALIDHADVRVALVDRRDSVGGHWREAYPFVRLHQSSTFYGVASTCSGAVGSSATAPRPGCTSAPTSRRSAPTTTTSWRTGCSDRAGSSSSPAATTSATARSSRGTRASGSRCPSGAGSSTRATSPPRSRPRRRRASPSTTAPAWSRSTTWCGLEETPSQYVVVGSGKTATDACVWLLARGVDPDAICWVRPRDPWMLNRALIQPDPAIYLGMVADMMRAAGRRRRCPSCSSRLEDAGIMLRIDRSVTPTMAKAPTLGTWELDLLRTIENVVRLGHIDSREPRPDRAEHGSVAVADDALVVNCAADGLKSAPLVPIWGPEAITLQPIRAGFPCFGPRSPATSRRPATTTTRRTGCARRRPSATPWPTGRG